MVFLPCGRQLRAAFAFQVSTLSAPGESRAVKSAGGSELICYDCNYITPQPPSMVSALWPWRGCFASCRHLARVPDPLYRLRTNIGRLFDIRTN
jgi:hypothetical protein